METETIERAVSPRNVAQIEFFDFPNPTGRKTELFIQPQTVTEDHRSYRSLKLVNGMKVLLVHDTHIDEKHTYMDFIERAAKGQIALMLSGKMACFNLSINIGCNEDPKEFQGLSRLLNLMFLRHSTDSEKRVSWSKFATLCGKFRYAYDCETTNFGACVDDNYVNSLLKRTASWLVDPTITLECVRGACQQLDNEFKNIKNVPYYQLQSLFSRTSIPSHPNSQFQHGSRKSLLENHSCREVREAALNFKKKYYTPDRITLCLHTTKSLDVMQEMVETTFSQLPIAKPVKISYPFPIDMKKWNKYFCLQSKVQNRSISMTWCLHPVDFSTAYVIGYLNALLDDPSSSALNAFLRKKGLGSASARVFSHNMRSHCIYYTVGVRLTKIGAQHTGLIALTTLQYLQNLKQIDHTELIETHGRQSEINFHKLCLVKSDINFSFDTAKAMHRCEPAKYIMGQFMTESLTTKNVKKVLNMMTESSCCFVETGKPDNTSLSCFDTDDLYGTRYACSDIPEKVKNMLGTSIIDKTLVPSKNPYVCESNPFGSSLVVTSPLKIMSTYSGTLWCEVIAAQDHKGHCWMELCNDSSDWSLEREACMTLFLYMLELELSAIPGYYAGYSYSISYKRKNIQLHVSGYVPKLQAYVDAIMQAMTKLTENTPDKISWKVAQDFFLVEQEIPDSVEIAKDVLRYMGEPLHFTYFALLTQISKLNADIFHQMCSTIVKSAYLRMHVAVSSNCIYYVARDIFSTVQKHITHSNGVSPSLVNSSRILDKHPFGFEMGSLRPDNKYAVFGLLYACDGQLSNIYIDIMITELLSIYIKNFNSNQTSRKIVVQGSSLKSFLRNPFGTRGISMICTEESDNSCMKELVRLSEEITNSVYAWLHTISSRSLKEFCEKLSTEEFFNSYLISLLEEHPNKTRVDWVMLDKGYSRLSSLKTLHKNTIEKMQRVTVHDVLKRYGEKFMCEESCFLLHIHRRKHEKFKDYPTLLDLAVTGPSKILTKKLERVEVSGILLLPNLTSSVDNLEIIDNFR